MRCSPTSSDAELIAEMSEQCPVVRPRFEPGDALIFDDRFLHSTGVTDGMTAEPSGHRVLVLQLLDRPGPLRPDRSSDGAMPRPTAGTSGISRGARTHARPAVLPASSLTS